MAAVTKSKGAYFYDYERVWAETKDAGVLPYWIGKAPGRMNLPVQPNPQLLKSLFEGGRYLPRVQANRVGCFDVTVSFDKSVSLLAYGLTPPGQWKDWTETFKKVADPVIGDLLDRQKANSGPQGKVKQPSTGLAAGFWHTQGFRGQPHAHAHYAVANLTVDGKNKVGSIANAHLLYEEQGVVRARIQKGVDDALQARGIETVRVGKRVAVAGVPKALIDELSPARQAMNAARQAKGFTGARAQDFYARQARRDHGPRVHKTPEERHRDCKEAAARHGVTLDSLTKGKAAPRDAASEMGVAYGLVKKALAQCSKKHGAFTSDQFFEKLYTLGIGQPTTVKALDAMGQAVLKHRSMAGVSRHDVPGSQPRYSTRQSAKAQQAATKNFRPDTKEAWDELKNAVKGLGAAVFVKTAKKAAEVTQRISEAINPPPRKLRVDAARLPELIGQLSPTPFFKAHAKAIFAGVVKARGNPHERAAAAEKVYEKLRSHARLPKNAVLVVERGSLASAVDLRRLEKIARRDGVSVILSEPNLPPPSNARSHNRQQGRSFTL